MRSKNNLDSFVFIKKKIFNYDLIKKLIFIVLKQAPNNLKLNLKKMGKSNLKLLLFLLSVFIFLYSFSSSDLNQKSTPKNYETLDIETISWLDRVSLAGGSVSDSIISAVDDYVKEVKGLKYQSYSIRNLLFRENWFCGDFNAAFVPVFINSDGSSEILGNSVDSNFNLPSSEYADTGLLSGWKGNGTDRYISTGFNPYSISTFSPSDAHFMIYSMSDTIDAGRMGCRKNEDGFYIYPKYTNGNTYFAINAVEEEIISLPSSRNYISVQRISSQLANVFYMDNQVNTVQHAYTRKPNIDFTIGAFNNNGLIRNHLSIRLGGYSIGKSFLGFQQQIHYNAVQRLMKRLGRELPGGMEADIKSNLFVFTGNKLNVNYKTKEGGIIRFEIQDANGEVIDDRSIEKCIPLTGDSFMETVTWQNGSDLSGFVNTPVYLRVIMSNADLFSVQFPDEIVSIDSTLPGMKAGAYKQFFADTLFFGNEASVQTKMHSPVKLPEPIISPEMPWEGNFIVTNYSNVYRSMSTFSNQMVYKMWLRAKNSLGNFPAYYESVDGISWTRPVLESFKYNGSIENNIINDAPYPGGFFTVIDDSAYNKTDSTRRYKSVYNTHPTYTDSRLNVSFSYDGLVWIPYEGNPVRYIGEDLSSCGWNPVLKKYLGYFRDSLAIRKVGRYISDDWINWTYTGTVLKPLPTDIKTTHFYNMEVLFKDSVYWGFAGVMRLNEYGNENPPSPTRTDNTNFIALVFSRDGINFVRCGNTQAFLNYGELGSWDDQMVYTIGVPVRVGNEFYIYYNGFNIKHYNNGSPPPPHSGGPAKSHIGLAKIGLDRFISLSTY